MSLLTTTKSFNFRIHQSKSSSLIPRRRMRTKFNNCLASQSKFNLPAALPFLSDQFPKSHSEFGFQDPMELELQYLKDHTTKTYNFMNCYQCKHNFEMLYEILKREAFILCQPDETINALEKKILKYLFTPAEKISKSLYNDSSVKLVLTSWDAYDNLYRCLLLLINYDAAKEKNSIFETKETIINIMKLLESPDENERRAIEMILNRILSKFPKIHRLIYHQALRMFDDYAWNNGSRFPIDVLCRLISVLIKDKEILMILDIFKLHTTVMKLFTTDFLGTYYFSLFKLVNTLLSIKSFPKPMVLDSIRYLLNHFPISSMKQYYFLNQIIVLLKDFVCKLQIPQKLLAAVESKLNMSLRSGYISVQVALIKYISDNNIFKFLVAIRPSFYNSIMESLNYCTNSWAYEVREDAKNVLSKVSYLQMKESLNSETECEEKKNDYKIIWRQIKKLAVRNAIKC